MHSVGAPLAPGQADVPWPCNPGEVHRPFSRDAGDLVLRFRLRRQCAAGKEVFRIAHRLEHRARRRLDGGAHADSRRRGSARRKDLHGGGVSERLRQDQPGDAHPARRDEGLEGVDGRRRHRLDQTGPERLPCERSIQKRVCLASRRERRERRIPMPWRPSRATPSSRTWP